MPIQVQTSLMAGGLDLMTPPIAMPPGKAIAAINYEPDVSGYTSHGGFERFDGSPRPSDVDPPVPANIEYARNGIGPPAGTGTVRGVWVYNGDVYAFRDQLDGYGGMFKATQGGWQRQQFGYILDFSLGEAPFVEGEIVAGTVSGWSGHIDRIITRDGDYDPDTPTASGYMIVSQVHGTFNAVGEELTAASGGVAFGVPPRPVQLLAGGRYEFVNHNFYGAAARTRMYFVNGVDTAFEWSDGVLSPIYTGISSGTELGVVGLLAPIQRSEPPGGSPDYDTERIVLAADDSPIVMSALFDAPSFIGHYKNHLFLGYTSGTLLHSALGEPLEYTTISGAGEIAFGEQITGLLSSASTSLIVVAQNRIQYLTGDDATNFILNPLTDASGAQQFTLQMMDAPMFLDDGGVRQLSTAASFGDWRMGSATQPVETLIRQKRDTGVSAVASLRVKSKDQYRLFWGDMTGITVFIGRKSPETLPFKLPIQVNVACSGEVDVGHGERLFVGCQDGYVYELDRGTSFDGAPIQTYVRLPFTAAGSPMQETRWTKATFEIATPDPIDVGVAFDVDYARGLGGEKRDVAVDAGAPIITTDIYDPLNFVQPVQGRLEYHLAGIGPNIAATLVTEASDARQHTISSQTYNFSRRRLKR